jgi:hypothetical protein
MSRWTYNESGEGELVLTCKGPTVTLNIYSSILSGEPDDPCPPTPSFNMSPEKALEMSEWLALYAKEAKTYR